MSGRRIQIIIAGATGYTGSELVRLLLNHPAAEISAFVSSGAAGESVADKIPYWRGQRPMVFEPLTNLGALTGDVVFFATPHGVAMREAAALLTAGKVIIDIGADFRLRDTADFARWYGEHTAAELLPQAVYGLTEYARDAIKNANLIACPGCYATAIELALLPFIAGDHISGDIIAHAQSGTSGAGRRSDRPDLLLAEMANNYKAYAIDGHRHHAEIIQTLATTEKFVPPLTFIPHLLPLSRGLFASLYLTVGAPDAAVDAFSAYWQGNPFIEVLPPPLTVELAQVIHSNRIVLSAHPLSDTRLLVCAALDNLIKGAAGQAVQNMNIRFGIDETCGLPGARAV